MCVLGRREFHNWVFEGGSNGHSGWANKAKMYPVIFIMREFGAGDSGFEVNSMRLSAKELEWLH